MNTHDQPESESYNERARMIYSRLCRREDVQSIAFYSVVSAPPESGDFMGEPNLRKLVQAIDEGETWILKRSSPVFDKRLQSVYIKRENGIAVALAVETGHPIIKSIHRMLRRTLAQLQGKTKLRSDAIQRSTSPTPSESSTPSTPLPS